MKKIIEKLGITPGPWDAEKDEFYGSPVYQIMHKTGRNIRAQFGKMNGKENAQLIAAAPEMLEALIHTMKFAEDSRYLNLDLMDIIKSSIEKICYPKSWQEIKELIDEEETSK